MGTLTMGERIAALRKEKGLTQQQLAQKMYIKREVVNYYEADSRLPKIDDIRCLSVILGVTSDYLLGLTDIPSSDASELELNDRTGLSMESIRMLEQTKQFSEVTSRILGSPFFESILSGLDNMLKVRAELENRTESGGNPQESAEKFMPYLDDAVTKFGTDNGGGILVLPFVDSEAQEYYRYEAKRLFEKLIDSI